MTIEITTEKMLGALEKVVEEAGRDYTYPLEDLAAFNDSCRYVIDGRPACIVGRALHRLGVPIEDLSQVEDESAYRAIELLVNRGTVTVDGIGPGDVASAAQSVQDRSPKWTAARRDWGHALEMARIAAGENEESLL